MCVHIHDLPMCITGAIISIYRGTLIPFLPEGFEVKDYIEGQSLGHFGLDTISARPPKFCVRILVSMVVFQLELSYMKMTLHHTTT